MVPKTAQSLNTSRDKSYVRKKSSTPQDKQPKKGSSKPAHQTSSGGRYQRLVDSLYADSTGQDGHVNNAPQEER